MADGLFYNDARPPWLTADPGSVTLASTDKALYTTSNFPILGGNYFNYVGKKLRIELFGRITTSSSAGNGTWDIYWGTGADANGTIIMSSAAQALTTGQTNLSWYMQCMVACRSVGSSGTLFGTGFAIFNEGVVAPHMLIPASAPAVSGALDLTAANIVSVQFKRSGTSAETMQIHDMNVIALN